MTTWFHWLWFYILGQTLLQRTNDTQLRDQKLVLGARDVRLSSFKRCMDYKHLSQGCVTIWIGLYRNSDSRVVWIILTFICFPKPNLTGTNTMNTYFGLHEWSASCVPSGTSDHEQAWEQYHFKDGSVKVPDDYLGADMKSCYMHTNEILYINITGGPWTVIHEQWSDIFYGKS